MPIYQDFSTDSSRILIWKHHQSDSLPESLIPPSDFEKVKGYHPKKLLEYLMIRRMLSDIKPGAQILYREIGQPYLQPKDAFISISHSFPFAALAISDKRVGIDLEKTVPKILRVKHKFLNEYELLWTASDDEAELLTIIWAIKEALYKLHPSKYWSLKKYYEVERFQLDCLERIHCRVFDDTFEDRYNACVKKMEGYYFAVIEEDHAISFKVAGDSYF